MKIEEVRPSFTVYAIASQIDRLEGLTDSLSLAGYMVVNFTELTAAFSELQSNPPHFVLFDAAESGFPLKKGIKQVTAQLPETHIILVTPVDQREQAAVYLEEGVYDLILTPLSSQTELVRSLDRAAERDYFMYMNERLMAAPPASAVGETTSPAIASDIHRAFTSELFRQKTSDACVEVFLKSVSGLMGTCPAVYFRYLANRRVLMAMQGYAIEGVELSGLGLDFNAMNSGFRASQLRDPMSVGELRGLINEVFHTSEYFALPIEVFNELQGIAVFLRTSLNGEFAATLQEWTLYLERALSLLEAEKRLHVMSVKDPATDLFNRATFLAKVREEVSRARRTNLPVALVMVSIDPYTQMVNQAGQDEAHVMLKMVARIFEKHSRVNDILGRTGPGEFGVILPHTGRQGALIKAERLRRIIESADFSRVVAAFAGITISLGVSEYPSMVRDADELLQSSGEALDRIREIGNRTCVARAPEGFVADFDVREKDV